MAVVASQFTAVESVGISDIVGDKVAIDPGVEQDLIDFTVAANKERKIYKLQMDCRAFGEFEIFRNGDMIGSGKTGPAAENVAYYFPPSLPLVASDQFVVKFTAMAGSPPVDVGSWVHYTEKDA